MRLALSNPAGRAIWSARHYIDTWSQ